MSQFNDMLSISMRVSPQQSLKCDWVKTPRQQKTGSILTNLKSGSSRRSKFTSSSKLTKSMLFKTIRGFNSYQSCQLQQKNLQSQLLQQAIYNVQKQNKNILMSMQKYFIKLGRQSSTLAQFISSCE